MDKKTTTRQITNLAYRILTPIGLALTILLAIGIFTSQKQLEIALSEHVSRQLDGLSEEFKTEISHKSNVLESTLLLLRDNHSLNEAFEKRDKKRLLTISETLLNKALKKNHISHFYFTDRQRVNFLRVHDPDRSGDIINRLTTIEAEKTNTIITGIELGPLGTLTLRSVAPWYDNKGNNTGYVELGIDISFFLKEASEPNRLSLFLAIRKTLLSKKLWEQGQTLFGHSSNWEQFEDYAISSEHRLTEELPHHIPELKLVLESEPGTGLTKTVDESSYRWQSFPVDSFAEQNVGNIFVAVNVTDWLKNYNSIAYKTLLVYLFISLLLMFVLHRYISRIQDAEVLAHDSMERLHQLASFDQLTQLPNRQLFINELEQRLGESSRFAQQFAICFIDIDNFKNINDSMGHDQGDSLLQDLSHCLKGSLRDYDILSRFGGDEFVLLMPHTKPNEAAIIAEKLLQAANKAFLLKDEEVYVTISIGISIFPQDGDNRDILLRHADAAMYQAKEAGKNCYHFYTSDINDLLQRQRLIDLRLRNAIEKDELQLFYQPQFDLQSGKLSACEALLRWNPQQGEQISPAEFIPIAEKTSLINDIGNWVLEQACLQRKAWAEKGLDIRIDVNLSGRQLRNNNIYQVIEEKLNKHGLEFSDIGIELTENSLIEADENLIESMSRLIKQGTTIAIDDFGTGYSSLSYLKKFPITTVKIDKAFVRDAPYDPNDRAIMTAIVAMGHSLGLQVIVEGIETEHQEQIAREIGCDQAQGFYYQKPRPANEFNFQQLI